MKVTLELTDSEVSTAIVEYMQRRYPNANRYGLRYFQWRPRAQTWIPMTNARLKVLWETHVG